MGPCQNSESFYKRLRFAALWPIRLRSGQALRQQGKMILFVSVPRVAHRRFAFGISPLIRCGSRTGVLGRLG